MSAGVRGISCAPAVSRCPVRGRHKRMQILEKRALGSSGLSIVPLVFGGNVFGWTIDEKTSFDVLDAFVDHGFNAIDTADVYSRWKPGNTGG